MVYLIYNILFLNERHCLPDYGFMAILDVAYELLSSQASKFCFEDSERGLDGIEVWRISYVVDVLEAKLTHGLLALL